ncbi:MAG: hypothetical protein WA733_12345 [Methylocystis sp.]
MIAYQTPTPLTPAQEQRLADSTTYLREQNALGWAAKSLSEGKLGDGWTLANAIAFARARDSDTVFDARRDVGGHAAQSSVSAIAACAIRFEAASAADREWAWDVMGRVERMTEPERFPGSKIPWHPAIHLILALVHDRRSISFHEDSAQRLLRLTAYPIDHVAQLAFQGLFMDLDDHVRWVAAQLAMDLSLYRKPLINERGELDDSANQLARNESLSRALINLMKASETPFVGMPPAWVKVSRRRRSRAAPDGEEEWGDPDPSFNTQFASKLFPHFPIEAWGQSSTYRPILQTVLSQLVTWTAERLMPSWRDRKTQRDRQTALHEWNAVLGDLLARAAPFFEMEWVRQHFLAPFLADNEEALPVLSQFADRTVARHVLDAPNVPANTLALLGDCVERVVRDPIFSPGRYHSGDVHGSDMPALITALLFVAVEQAPGAARLVNGDWSQISLVLPIVTRLVSAVGWSSFVMQKFLTLCERAGLAYPLDEFSRQVNAALGSLANAKGSWAGTMLPARMAGIIQRQADGNYPLRLDQAQALLKVLDALVDLGDRRSAALEQNEAFRSVQGRSA